MNRGRSRKFRKKGLSPPLSPSNENSIQPGCIIITTLKKRLEGLGSHKNVLKIQEKKGGLWPPRPLP